MKLTALKNCPRNTAGDGKCGELKERERGAFREKNKTMFVRRQRSELTQTKLNKFKCVLDRWWKTNQTF